MLRLRGSSILILVDHWDSQSYKAIKRTCVMVNVDNMTADKGSNTTMSCISKTK